MEEPLAPEETPPRSDAVELVPELLDPAGLELEEPLSIGVALPEETPPRSDAVELVPELLEPDDPDAPLAPLLELLLEPYGTQSTPLIPTDPEAPVVLELPAELLDPAGTQSTPLMPTELPEEPVPVDPDALPEPYELLPALVALASVAVLPAEVCAKAIPAALNNEINKTESFFMCSPKN